MALLRITMEPSDRPSLLAWGEESKLGGFGGLIKVAESSHSHLLINFLHLSLPFGGGNFHGVTFLLLLTVLMSQQRIVPFSYRNAPWKQVRTEGANIL